MEELLHKLETSRNLLVQLGSEISRLKRENETLSQAVQEAQGNLDDKVLECEEWKQKYEALRLAKSMDNPEAREALQAKIDLYLNEINTCLKLFGD